MIKKVVIAFIASVLISTASAQTAPARQAPAPTSVPQAGKEAPQTASGAKLGAQSDQDSGIAAF